MGFHPHLSGRRWIVERCSPNQSIKKPSRAEWRSNDLVIFPMESDEREKTGHVYKANQYLCVRPMCLRLIHYAQIHFIEVSSIHRPNRTLALRSAQCRKTPLVHSFNWFIRRKVKPYSVPFRAVPLHSVARFMLLRLFISAADRTCLQFQFSVQILALGARIKWTKHCIRPFFASD